MPPPSSCGDGFCGCCMAQIRTGEVHMPRRDALTDDDVKKGWVLACQASPAGAELLWVDFDARY
jgi:3-ketosteroid 9alpha-monooxygenase subunit B